MWRTAHRSIFLNWSFGKELLELFCGDGAADWRKHAPPVGNGVPLFSRHYAADWRNPPEKRHPPLPNNPTGPSVEFIDTVRCGGGYYIESRHPYSGEKDHGGGEENRFFSVSHGVSARLWLAGYSHDEIAERVGAPT